MHTWALYPEGLRGPRRKQRFYNKLSTRLRNTVDRRKNTERERDWWRAVESKTGRVVKTKSDCGSLTKGKYTADNKRKGETKKRRQTDYLTVRQNRAPQGSSHRRPTDRTYVMYALQYIIGMLFFSFICLFCNLKILQITDDAHIPPGIPVRRRFY
jgi:hypothetical protein